MSLPHLTPILPSEATEADLRWLDKFVREWSYDGSDIGDYLERVASGSLRLVRVGDFQGLIGLEFVKRPYGLECWMEFTSGEGLLGSMEEILAGVLELAKRAGATKFRTSSGRDAMTKLALQRTGLSALSTILGKDIE